MSEIAMDQIQTFPLDHYGIIAAVGKALRIAERVDGFLGVHEKRIVTLGQAVVAMIINGLGFINRRLYLMHQFFAIRYIVLVRL